MAKDKGTGTPLMRQYQEVKSAYPDTIVLFRMGDFYETFNEDAKITAKILGIVLTKRANGSAADVPLAGFPHHALDSYLYKLVNAGYRVAICEQVEDPKLAKGIVKREVVEVVTPGTITADVALNEKKNHFIACLAFHREQAGVAVLDQSTGDFQIGECPQVQLPELLEKFAPREVVIPESVVYSTTPWYRSLKPFITSIEDWVFNFEQSYQNLTRHFQVTSLKGFGCEDYSLGIIAAGALFYHIKHDLNGALEHVDSLSLIPQEGIMGLDGFTIRNLEVFKSLATQGTHGTLLDLLDETHTAGGGRLLRQWLKRPLTRIEKLNRRLDLVSGLVQDKRLLKKIRQRLKGLIDIERVIGRVSQGKAGPRDLLGLQSSLTTVPEFQEDLNQGGGALTAFARRFVDTNEVVQAIAQMINSEAPAQLGQGPVIRSGVNQELDELRNLVTGGKQWIANLQKEERERTGIPSLKVGYNKVFGYYLEITKTHQDKVPETYIRKQTLVNAERYITPELKEYEEKLLTAEAEIAIIEARIFEELCQTVLQKVGPIQTNARLLNQLDIVATFAILALKYKYVRPELVEDSVLRIKDGRHPVVERLLPATERFVPNSTFMDIAQSQIHLITGPNMAGKSTYLRQIGLIVLMAHMGCFVPAREATIGIVDKLFTRVGASDNLAGGESTFLVEMNEASNIVNNATSRSLILLDEIGRGTATYDGLSLAWAITEYLHQNRQVAARTLFATHYHELTELEHTLSRLENYHATVKEFGDRIVFLRKIQRGPGDRSYGIHVAQMAGLPTTIIQRAREILNHHLALKDLSTGTKPPTETSKQISLFEAQESELKKDLSAMDINSITPLQALEALDALKKKHGL